MIRRSDFAFWLAVFFVGGVMAGMLALVVPGEWPCGDHERCKIVRFLDK